MHGYAYGGYYRKGILEGTPVEIIGKNQTFVNFAAQLDTIPYEVLTSLSSRVHRNYIVH